MFIAFRLKPGKDDDLIKWLESLGSGDKSYFIRETLRRNLNAQKGGSNYALPPSPPPVIGSDKDKEEDIPKRTAKEELDIKRSNVSVDDLEKAIEIWI